MKKHWQQVIEQIWPSTWRVAADVAFIRTFRQSFFGSTAVAALVNVVVQPRNFATVDWEFVGMSLLAALAVALLAAGNAWNDVMTNGPSTAYTSRPHQSAPLAASTSTAAQSVKLFTEGQSDATT